jgi:hypothetical protein
MKIAVWTESFLVAGRGPLGQKICFLLFPGLFTTRRCVGVDVGRPVPDNTGQLLVIGESVLEAFGLTDVDRYPVIWGSLLYEDIVSRLVHKSYAHGNNPILVLLPRCSHPNDGLVCHNYSSVLPRI